MECIYSEILDKSTENILISGDQAKHLHVLRLKSGDSVQISNGSGLMASAVIMAINNKNYQCKIIRVDENTGELNSTLDLAFGLIADKNRLEFLIEKSTELGIKNFYPLITRYVQKKFLNVKRLEAKVLAAMKQSKRSVLPSINAPLELMTFLSQLDHYDITDIDGKSATDKQLLGSTLIFVGPEGGFTHEEIAEIKKQDPILWNLGNRRLRAETAAILSVGFASMMIRLKKI